jgi:hypothetical protein
VEIARLLAGMSGTPQFPTTILTMGDLDASQLSSDPDLPRILIVEDSPTQALKLRRTLEQAGYPVIQANDGRQGLAKARDTHPDLIISDVSMPHMDGFEMCHHIKTDPTLRDTPVILLTALTTPGEILSGLDAGADNYLTKPVDEPFLLNRVSTLLHPPPTEDDTPEGLAITFEGRTYHISSSRQQILNLLLSTYQKVIQQNRELTDSQLELKMLNMELVDQSTKLELLNRQLQTENQERRRVETRQAALLNDLTRANRELADFAYVVSHDLKAPARAIGSLTSWLATDYAHQLDKEGQELVTLLEGRANRMNALIEAILEYTQVNRINEHLVEIPLTSLVRDIIRQIKAPEIFQWRVPPDLPTILLEKKRATQIFFNLLDNAVRFMDKPEGMAQITWNADPDWWHFHITDNGPGIDPKYHDKVFGVFQTLHPRDQLDTTGVGLALVQKIITKYTGNIRIESALDQGCTIHFTLPKQPAPPENTP